MMDESFKYYKQIATGYDNPHLRFRENENCLADVVVKYRPLFYSMVTKYGFLGQDTIFNVYIDCILDCLKRYEEGKGNQTFGNYLKVAFTQGCLTEITKNNCDKRKANIGTFNFDDIFDENTSIVNTKDEDQLNLILAICDREDLTNGLRK